MSFQGQGEPDGILNKYEASIIAKGYHQQFGFDFNEKKSPVMNHTIIRVILTLGLTNKWELNKLT